MMKVDQGPVACKYLAVLALFVSQSSIADSYLCEAERASGFVYDQDSKTWETSGFSIEDRKYLVTRTDQDDIFIRALKYDYEIKKADSQHPIIQCKAVKYIDSNEETGLIACRGPFGASFNIDKRNGRYIRSQPTGYVTMKINSNSNSSTDMGTANGPYMEIGNCSAK